LHHVAVRIVWHLGILKLHQISVLEVYVHLFGGMAITEHVGLMAWLISQAPFDAACLAQIFASMLFWVRTSWTHDVVL